MVLSASVKITVGAVFKCSFYDFIEMRTRMQKTKKREVQRKQEKKSFNSERHADMQKG